MAAKTATRTKGRPADYIGDMTQLDMVLDARKVLAELGATDAEWAANTMLVNRYSNGAWIAVGREPARRNTATPVPVDNDHRPVERELPRGNGNGTASRPAPRHGDEPVTTPQRDLVTRLANKHLDADAAAALIALCDQRTKRTISSVISSLLDMDRANPRGDAAAAPAARATDADLPAVPSGRYAILGSYFKIDNGKGRWEGRLFIREIDAHGDEITNVRDHARKLEITTAIAADPAAAVIAYGKATGTCGSCNTGLEDPESIARGIGPYCEADAYGITVNEVYRRRKANPAAAPAPTASEPVNETTPAPAPAPAPAATADGKPLDQMSFAELMVLAKAHKVPGRGTARLPQLREGVAKALAAAAA